MPSLSWSVVQADDAPFDIFTFQRYPSGKLHELLDIKLSPGHAHSADHDACSLAAVCQELDRRDHNVLPWSASLECGD